MTKWSKDIMPNDALDPDSLVGRMLNPLTDETGPGDVTFNPEPEPLPLWRVMHADDFPPPVPECYAAEIEALRDWLLPEGDEPPFGTNAPWWVWEERQRLRAILTEQARIARTTNQP